LLGYYDGKKLRYAGRTGTGFTRKPRTGCCAPGLTDLEVKETAFVDVPRDMRRGAHWVKPELVAQVEFSTWTRDNLVRQAAFKGLREDKPAREVARERPDAPVESQQNTARLKRGAAPRSRRIGKEAAGMAQPTITHPDKVLDPESGMTKRQLADYYAAVAEHLLPHIADRPLSVVRCPEGNSRPCFFQKHVGLGLPAGVKTVAVRSRTSGKDEDYLTVDSTEGLLGLAQMGVMEIHPWGSRNESLDRPDRIVFDLDPDVAIDWKTLAETAQRLRERLKELNLESFLKSTGGKGLHVVVPIRPEHEWAVIKDFAHRLAMNLAGEKPDLYVTKMTRATRKNRIYLDYLRNDRGSTAVAPYSPRARRGTPVAMPLGWNELDTSKPPSFHVCDFANWRSRLKHDPWAAMPNNRQRLAKATAE
jgi:bifunctional non-homologous end joining protein LigD